MSEHVHLADSMTISTGEQRERLPKITQYEAAFLLSRGPYISRLAAQEKLLAYARGITTREGELGPNLPEYVIEGLLENVEQARNELDAFDLRSCGETVAVAEPEVQQSALVSVRRPLGERSVRSSLTLLNLDVSERPESFDWREAGLCAQTEPEAFFPERGGSTRESKKVCLKCEVREECLEYALYNDERHGVWGGLSERERRKLKKRSA